MLILALQIAATALVAFFITILGMRMTAPGLPGLESRLHTAFTYASMVCVAVLIVAMLVAIWAVGSFPAICG